MKKCKMGFSTPPPGKKRVNPAFRSLTQLIKLQLRRTLWTSFWGSICRFLCKNANCCAKNDDCYFSANQTPPFAPGHTFMIPQVRTLYTEWSVIHGRVFLVPYKKWLVQRASVQLHIANTGQVTFYKVPEKQGHVYMAGLYVIVCQDFHISPFQSHKIKLSSVP